MQCYGCGICSRSMMILFSYVNKRERKKKEKSVIDVQPTEQL